MNRDAESVAAGLYPCTCGEQPRLFGNCGQPKELWFVACDKCEEEVDAGNTSPGAAISAWNNRALQEKDNG